MIHGMVFSDSRRQGDRGYVLEGRSHRWELLPLKFQPIGRMVEIENWDIWTAPVDIRLLTQSLPQLHVRLTSAEPSPTTLAAFQPKLYISRYLRSR
jgi:hypothetical protein